MATTSDDAPTRVKAANWLLFVLGAVNLIAGTLFAILRVDATLATLMLAAGLVLLLAANAERFASIKGMGVELTMKIQQADEVLAKLRAAMEMICPVVIDTNSRIGRWDGSPPPDLAYKLTREVEAVLLALGTPKPTIHRHLRPWARTLAMDVARQLIRETHYRITTTQGDGAANLVVQKLVAASNEMHSWPLERFPTWLREARRFDLGLNDVDKADFEATVDKWAPEFEFLRDTISLRDPEAWFEVIERGRVQGGG